MTEPLSALGTVVALQQMYGIPDTGIYEGGNGWILTQPLNNTIFYVSKVTGDIKITQAKWEDWK